MGDVMLEAKYYKDYRHNYMILRCEWKERMNSYQHKILTSNKIGEILSCSVRHINGTTYYYYDISSRTTLEGLYRGRKMTYAQVRDVLYQLCGICEKLSGYFMEEIKLVLQPEHIYYDFTNDKYIGLYYPDYQAEGADAYRPLMDFLLEHIDTDDTRLTEDIYRLYEMAEDRHFCIEDALKILDDREEETCNAAKEANDSALGLESSWEPSEEEMSDKSVLYDGTDDLSTEEQFERKAVKRSLFYPVFSVLLTIGIAGAAVVCSMYELTQEEQLALYGCAAVMGVCLLICLAGILNGRKRSPASIVHAQSRQKCDSNFREETEKPPNIECFAEPMLSLEHVISRDMNLEMAENKPMCDRTTKYSSHTTSYCVDSYPVQEDGNYGNTVFFDGSEVAEYKLYAVDRKNKRHIELKHFPFTVGKMAGCVDYVLPDNSVSRIHVRFDKQGDNVMMTDMNSTNGTYKNGLRMQPQETVMIEPGDEIRFGNLNYCYR